MHWPTQTHYNTMQEHFCTSFAHGMLTHCHKYMTQKMLVISNKNPNVGRESSLRVLGPANCSCVQGWHVFKMVEMARPRTQQATPSQSIPSFLRIFQGSTAKALASQSRLTLHQLARVTCQRSEQSLALAVSPQPWSSPYSPDRHGLVVMLILSTNRCSVVEQMSGWTGPLPRSASLDSSWLCR